MALLSESGGVVSHRFTLGPRQRQSVSINTVLGAAGAVAIIVESDVAGRGGSLHDLGHERHRCVTRQRRAGARRPRGTSRKARPARSSSTTCSQNPRRRRPPSRVATWSRADHRSPGHVPSRRRAARRSSSTRTTRRSPRVAGIDHHVGRADLRRARRCTSTAAARSAAARRRPASTQLSTQWYFGEGATGPFFQAFLAMLNPGTHGRDGDGDVSPGRRLDRLEGLYRARRGAAHGVVQRRGAATIRRWRRWRTARCGSP